MWLLFAVGWVVTVPEGYGATSEDVLIVDAGHAGFRWGDQIRRGIRETLGAAAPGTRIFVEFLDRRRIDSPAALERLADLMVQKYRRMAFKAVVAVDGEAVEFLGRYRRRLFAGVPTVVCGIADPTPADRRRLAPVTGVDAVIDARETIAQALELLPGTRRVVVAGDAGAAGRQVRQAIARAASAFAGRVRITYWESLSRPLLLRRLAGLKPGDIVLTTFYHRDGAGQLFSNADSIRRICEASPVPVFGLFEYNLGLGIIGGKLTRGLAQGRAAGQLVVKLLDRHITDSLPPPAAVPNRFAFDEKVLERFGIDPSALPAGYTLMNASISVPGADDTALKAVLAVLLGLLVLVFRLLLNRGGEDRPSPDRRSRRIHDSLPDLHVAVDRDHLRQAEQNLRLMEMVVQNSPVVLFRWRAAPDWPVDYVSENVAQFGYSAADLTSGKVPFAAVVHPDDLARVAREVTEHVAAGDAHFQQEYCILTASGETRWVDDRTLVERDAEGVPIHFQGVILDITDRKRAQQEIVRRQGFLESVLYHAPDAIVTLDDRHRVIDWNPGAEKIFGYTQAEVLGRELDELVSRDAMRTEANGKTRRVLGGVRVDAFETVRYRKDGRPVRVIAAGSPIMIDGTLGGVVAMYTDITALKQAESALRRNERRLRRIIDIVPSLISVKNAEGRFLMANKATAERYGMTVDQLVGRLQSEVHPDRAQVAGYLADDAKVIENGDPLFVRQEPYRTQTGAERWMEVVKVACDIDDFGEPAVFALATDITERQAVQARLEESERRYRTMFENTGTGTVLSEADTTLSMVNSEFARMVGYRRDEIEGRMSWTRFIVPEDVERMKGYHYDRRRDPLGAPTQWECGIVDRYGRVKRMLLKVRLIPGTQTSIGSFLDISDRKRAEEALVDTNRMLRLVLDTIPVRVFWKDTDSHYLGCNRAFAGDAGFSDPQALIGRDDYELAWNDQAQAYRRDDSAVMTTGTPRINYEEPQVGPDGRTVWLQTSKVPMRDSRDRIIGVLGTYQDITERKTAVEELQRLRNYLSNIIDSMPSVLVGVDEQGRVTQWNQQAQRLTGLTFENARRQPLGTVFPQLIDEMERIHGAIHDRQVIHDPKIARRVDGEVRYEDVTIFPLVANGVEGAVIRVDDVTERVRLEEMMIQSEKMLSVGGLAAGMAHEINNPLAGILQNAAVMENRLFGELPANQKALEAAGLAPGSLRQYLVLRKIPEMIANIRSSGNRAADIVKNMLSFARKSDRSVSTHDLGVLLDQTIELACTDYDMKKKYDFKQIKIVRDYDPAAVAVPCEASKIQQVFLNVLKNGAEAMASAPDDTHPPTFVLGLHDQGHWVRVEISDNGPGMDDATRRRIFEPFFTTKPVGEGTGLGLSVSYFIITENHGGKMDVASAGDRGTRFIISLPKTGKP